MGRHRGDGSRPSGKSNREKNTSVAKAVPTVTDPAQTTQSAAGSEPGRVMSA